jgi:tetratricopeptide (TPR) repeat protein
MKSSEPRFPGDFTPEEAEFARLLRERFGWQVGHCPSPDLLRALSDEVLPEAAAEAVSAHVESCAICSTLKQDLRFLEPAPPSKEQLRRARERIPRAARGFSGWLRPLPVLAAIAVAALGLWAIRAFTGRGTPSIARTPPSESLPPLQIAVTKAPVEIPSNMLLAYRGESDKTLPTSDEWPQALAAYQKDDFSRAAEDLGKIERKYPNFFDGHFYRGVALLLLNRDAEAIPSLEKAAQLAKNERLPDAEWYLGAALARQGRTAEAAKRWQAVCDLHQAHSDVACRDLPRLKVAR